MWEFYKNLIHNSGYGISDLPLSGTNEDGENVIVEYFRDENRDIVFHVTTAQNNGWMRINNYYKDGTSEELYEH